MDPERQWIARLEPETPQEEDELDESPLRRVPRLIGGGMVVVGGALQLAHVFGDATVLRLAVLAVVALVGAAVELIAHLRRANFAKT